MTASQVKGNPGAELAALREEKGYSQEYVAGKLYLRGRVIELIETGAYHELPQPVFVQGYIRAYAKLLEVDPNPILAQYEALKAPEAKVERILRQQNRQPRFREFGIPWLTVGGIFILFAVCYAFWHHSAPLKQLAVQQPLPASKVVLDEPVLTNLMNIESGLTLKPEPSISELHDG